MISIRVNKRYLELNPDTSVKLELVFPNPTEDNMPTSVVQWFDVPSTEENDITFERCKHIEIRDKSRVYEGVWFEAAGISMSGVMIVKTVTPRMYKVSIAFNPFPDGFRDTLLDELNLADYGLGANTDAIIATAKSYSQDNYPDVDIAFPMIYMGNFYGSDINTNFLYFINYYLNSAYVKNIEAYDENGNINCLVPHFYLLAVLDAVMAEADFDVSGSFTGNTDIAKLIVFNNYAIDKVRSSYIIRALVTFEKNITYPPYSLGFVNIITDSEEDPDGCWYIYEYTIEESGYITIQVIIDGQPDYNLTDHLYALFEIQINFTYAGLTDEEFQIVFDADDVGDYKTLEDEYTVYIPAAAIGTKIQIKTRAEAMTYHLDGGVPVEDGLEDVEYNYKNGDIYINPYAYNNVNVFDSTVHMQRHLPPISVSTFINSLVKMFCLAPFFNTTKKEVEFAFWNDIIDSVAVLDLTDYYIKDSEEIEIYKDIYKLHMPWTDGEIDTRGISDYTVTDSIFRENLPAVRANNVIYYCKDLNRWVISYYDDDSKSYGWMPYRDNFENINPDESDTKEISIDVNTLQMHYFGYPKSDMQGSSPEFGLGKTSFPFKLLFYHGICSSFLYDYLPYASSNQYKPDGTSNASFALRMNDTDGLYATFWEKWINYFETHDLVTMRLRIDENILAKIHALFTAGSHTRKVRVMNRNYIPVQVDVEIGMKGITNCEAKLR